MVNVRGMIWNGGIQIGNVQGAAIFRLRVVVFEAENPVAGRSLRGALAQRRLNRRDRTKVAIYHAQMRQSGCSWVRVRVDEARQHGLTAEIHLSNTGSSEIHQ